MRKGLTKLLRDYYRLQARTLYEGDFDTAVVLADLMAIINSDKLTARQRQYIALYYFVGLTFNEIASLVGVDVRNVKQPLYDGLDRAALVAQGDTTGAAFKRRTPDTFADKPGAVYRWLDAIAAGAPVAEPPHAVTLNIAELLSETDDKSAELARQSETGVVYIDETADDKPEYAHFSDSQLRWLDRRITLVENVLPPGDAVGSQKHIPAPEYDGYEDESQSRKTHATGRRKLFKLWGN